MLCFETRFCEYFIRERNRKCHRMLPLRSTRGNQQRRDCFHRCCTCIRLPGCHSGVDCKPPFERRGVFVLYSSSCPFGRTFRHKSEPLGPNCIPPLNQGLPAPRLRLPSFHRKRTNSPYQTQLVSIQRFCPPPLHRE